MAGGERSEGKYGKKDNRWDLNRKVNNSSAV
jgi:hypothetical protein